MAYSGGWIALTACQSASTTATIVVTPSATLAVPATAGPPTTLPNASPAVFEPALLTPAVAPSEVNLALTAADIASLEPTALVPTPLPLASTLPLDQPWLRSEDWAHLCGPNISSYRLVAVDRAGGQTQLDRGITAVTERPDAPPLLATCAADGSTALLDPTSWDSLPLGLAPFTIIDQMLVSPDQQQAIIQTSCRSQMPCDQSLPVQIYFVDLRTGALRLLENVNSSAFLSTWTAGGIYTVVPIDDKLGSSFFAVIHPTTPQASFPSTKERALITFDRAGKLLVSMDTRGSPRSLTLSELGQDTPQLIEQAAWLSPPAIAPDGTALAHFRSDVDQENSGTGSAPAELVLYDIIQRTKTVLTSTLAMPVDNS